jgi:VCBS repeat protein
VATDLLSWSHALLTASKQHVGRSPGFGRAPLWVAVIIVITLTAKAGALIRADYTPLELVGWHDTILLLRMTAPDEESRTNVAIVEAIKGAAPESVSMDIEAVAEDMLRDAFYDGDIDSADAMLFVRTVKDKEGNDERVGALNVGGRWFAAEPTDGGAWTIRTDRADLKGVWDGRTDMLAACVRYILRDRRARVPVKAGAAWMDTAKGPTISGTIHGARGIVLDPSAPPCVLVLSDSGDRLLRWDAETKALVDATASVGLATSSRMAEFGDFNADGRLDYASWNGKELSFHLAGADGKLGVGRTAGKLPETCLGLAVAPGAKGAAIIFTAPDGPWVVTLTDGEVAHEKIEGDPVAVATEEDMGVPRGCLAGDFDNDGLVDLVQPHAYGGLFHKGVGAGTFAAPQAVGFVGSGEKDAHAETGDFDGDGLLDVIVFSREGLFCWRNLGEGKFDGFYHIGEPDYIAKSYQTSGTVGDLNNDGRTDFVIFYRGAAMHPFFNRGFFTFGFAGEMDVMKTRLFMESSDGQVAGVLADIDGDGGQDCVCVLTDGRVFAVRRKTQKGRTLAVMVSPAPRVGGPVQITGYKGDRCLGVSSVPPGGRAFIGVEKPGPMRIEWRIPGGSKRSKAVIVERGVVRWVADGEALTRP